MSKKFLSRAIRHYRAHTKRDLLTVLLILTLFFGALIMFWVASFRMPDLGSFDNRKVVESTKIYDRTGEILLYDVHDSERRTVVASDSISKAVKDATVAIEDADFYEHKGIKISSIIRAVIANILTQEYSQGGSTITQQVIKNALLTTDKRISRKLKEWVLAPRLEKVMTKDQILTIYLNEIPYGGNIYGIEEASKQFFGKRASEVTVPEAAYLAAIPQATTYYSPYGRNRDKLEERKNLVLSRMKEKGFITAKEYDEARAATVEFRPQDEFGIKAAHFVMYVREELVRLYGEEMVDKGGLRVITTLDYSLQQKAEEMVKATALENTKNFNATNAGLVALDPKTGEILAMVGSRDYFDKEIDGNFNITTAHRQPGSTFKPIVYSKLFMKGYTPETVLFDLATEFSTECTPEGKPISASTDPETCYMPENYDEKFRGPMSIREALAQSINVPAIKALYLAGIRDSLALARDLGITSLGTADQYGLTLVLGGGEVSLLEMVGAYAVFANDGIRAPQSSILGVSDPKGASLRLPDKKSYQVLPTDVARTISDILSDNVARTPAYGANSVLNFPGYDVAAKTGTTNDYKDAWTIGYTSNVVIGIWAGNNDNTPMEKKVAGQIVAPLWSRVMREALALYPGGYFVPPEPLVHDGQKPVMRGIWQGGQTYTIDKLSGKLATEYTPVENREERGIRNVHSILYWVDKSNPLGPSPLDPSKDPQFERWERPVRAWAISNGYHDETTSVVPTSVDDIHTPENMPRITINNVSSSQNYTLNDSISALITTSGRYSLARVEVYINGEFRTSITAQPFIYRFSPSDIPNIRERNALRVIGIDSVNNRGEATIEFSVNLDQ